MNAMVPPGAREGLVRCSSSVSSEPTATIGSTPPSEFRVESELSPPPFSGKRTQDGEGGEQQDDCCLFGDNRPSNPTPQDSLPWALPPLHATSSYSVLIFIASNGGGPLLLPVMIVISLASWYEYPFTRIASVTFTFGAGSAQPFQHDHRPPTFSKTC